MVRLLQPGLAVTFVCSRSKLHFMRWLGTKPATALEKPPDTTSKKRSDPARWLPYMIAWPLGGVVGIAIYAWNQNSGSVLAVALLVAGAASASGCLLGFLFGIPRMLATEGAPVGTTTTGAGAASAEAERSSIYRSNTNLEQISDWLTKILVGVGLVELSKLSHATKRLVDFLAPALGDASSSPAFALSLLTFYGVTGFLIAYLLTRVYLGRVFAQADVLMQRIDEVEEAQRQQKRDLEALTLTDRYLNAGPDDPAIDQPALDNALTDASQLTRIQIFNTARQRRLSGTAEQKKRSEGIFRALIASDTDEIWHRNHGQLAYLLYDQQNFTAAEEELSTAIKIRDARHQRGFEIYELFRALSGIALDPKNASTEASDPKDVESIVADLRRVYASPWGRQEMNKKAAITSWMERNQLTTNDLKESQPPSP